jgi:hypothetical protein
VASTPTHDPRETLSIFAFALVVLSAVVGTAFAAGFLIGRMVL